MFKDLMKSIFSEEVELDDEAEVEEPKKKAKKVEKKVEPKVQKSEEPVAAEQTLKVQPTEKKVAQSEPTPVVQNVAPVQPVAKKPTSFGTLNADTVKKKEEKPRRKMYHYDRNKAHRIQPKPSKNLVYDYQSVVSPIFGNTADENKAYDKVHNAVELEKPKIHDGFDQVISPMFGSTIPTVKKSVDHIPQKKIKEDITIDSEVISLADILEKKKQKEPVVKQEKLFVSKN